VACLNDCIVTGSCTCVGDITAGSGPASPGPAPTGSSMTSVLGDDDPGPTLGTDDDITMPMQTLVLIVFMIAKLTAGQCKCFREGRRCHSGCHGRGCMCMNKDDETGCPFPTHKKSFV
jgi:hypothetical protein